jgi:NADH-quinone oxidoreductase subunit L
MSAADLIKWTITIATLAPLVSSVIVIFGGKRLFPGENSGWFATGVMGLSTVLSGIALWTWAHNDLQPIVWLIHWIPLPGTSAGYLSLGLLADGLGTAMVFMVSLIAMLVHMYSIGYMHGDSRFHWFFAYLSLFTFSMLGIVTANSLMQLFVFWELVGLTSYLLIGFWFEKRGPQLACKKAFVMNRIGDAGFLIGFGILFYKLGGNVLLPGTEGVQVGGHALTSMYGAIQEVMARESELAGLTGAAVYSWTNPPLWLTAAGIGLFFGAIGKSAQFPLHTWLPDAMEGPTPVSSIVHSATMVAAGVYLTGRIYAILTPAAHMFVATIGLITLIMAACMALVMTDIKRVLAYSTLSQLGYMVLGLGCGAYVYALYHLIAHAFFKCCLFQCSGSVINASHHQQDMRYYGGLGKKLPITAACYFVCTLAIAGASIPFTPVGISGFYSKHGIMAGAANYAAALTGAGWFGSLYMWGPIIVAYVTVFYMARSFALTFLGRPRDQHLYDHATEAPKTMLVPQMVLAGMAVISVPLILGFWQTLIEQTRVSMVHMGVELAPADAEIEHGVHMLHAPLLFGFGWIIALAAGLAMYVPGFKFSERIVRLPVVKQLYTWTYNKFYFDALYDVFTVNLGKTVAFFAGWIDRNLVDGLVNFAGFAGRAFASVVGEVDNKIVDGAVNGAATMAQTGGKLLRSTQPGRVRVYVTILFAAATLVTLIVITVAKVAAG